MTREAMIALFSTTMDELRPGSSKHLQIWADPEGHPGHVAVLVPEFGLILPLKALAKEQLPIDCFCVFAVALPEVNG